MIREEKSVNKITARELRHQARHALSQNSFYMYYVSALITLKLLTAAMSAIAILVFGGSALSICFKSVPFVMPKNVTHDELPFALLQSVSNWLQTILADAPMAMVFLLVAILVLAVLFTWIVGFASWGETALGIATMRGGVRFGHAFSGYGHGWKMGWICCQKSLYLLLWSLLFFVPAVVKSFSYALTDYIAVDHPDWSANRCIDESRRLMAGNRWRLFCLIFSFFPWYFALLVIYYWVRNNFLSVFLFPYIHTALAAFYEDLLDQDRASL